MIISVGLFMVNSLVNINIIEAFYWYCDAFVSVRYGFVFGTLGFILRIGARG